MAYEGSRVEEPPPAPDTQQFYTGTDYLGVVRAPPDPLQTPSRPPPDPLQTPSRPPPDRTIYTGASCGTWISPRN
eukprot:440467-Prorocentrum_minimum.AAC.2